VDLPAPILPQKKISLAEVLMLMYVLMTTLAHFPSVSTVGQLPAEWRGGAIPPRHSPTSTGGPVSTCSAHLNPRYERCPSCSRNTVRVSRTRPGGRGNFRPPFRRLNDRGVSAMLLRPELSIWIVSARFGRIGLFGIRHDQP
jgi:hypothetical protein